MDTSIYDNKQSIIEIVIVTSCTFKILGAKTVRLLFLNRLRCEGELVFHDCHSSLCK